MMNLPSGDIVRKGMALFQEQGDACMAISRERDTGGEWHIVTAKPVTRCQHSLLVLCGVLHKGACEMTDWSPREKAGHSSGSTLRGLSLLSELVA